jgi:hypothetical protein
MDGNVFMLVVTCLSVVAVAWILVYARIRPIQSQERLAALEKGTSPEVFYPTRVLAHVPWQFWTSFVVLLVLMLSYFLSAWLKLDEAQKSFLEMSKYVTGAVIGSIFCKGQGRRSDH